MRDPLDAALHEEVLGRHTLGEEVGLLLVVAFEAYAVAGPDQPLEQACRVLMIHKLAAGNVRGSCQAIRLGDNSGIPALSGFLHRLYSGSKRFSSGVTTGKQRLTAIDAAMASSLTKAS